MIYNTTTQEILNIRISPGDYMGETNKTTQNNKTQEIEKNNTEQQDAGDRKEQHRTTQNNELNKILRYYTIQRILKDSVKEGKEILKDWRGWDGLGILKEREEVPI